MPTALSASVAALSTSESVKVRPLVEMPAFVSSRQRGQAPATEPDRSTRTSTVNSRPVTSACTMGSGVHLRAAFSSVVERAT